MKAYRVYAHRVPLEGGDYTMDHTATVFMMNGKGRFLGIIGYQEPETTVRAKIRRLLDSE